MKPLASILLVLSAALLLIYPLWGLLSPESYAEELMAHYVYAEGFELGKVQLSAALLWLSNGVLALSLVALAVFLYRPHNSALLQRSGLALALYPFVRAFVEVRIALNLTAHVDDAAVTLSISAEKLFYLVMGIGLMAIAKVVSAPGASRHTEAPL
ncbi:hypothetical protein [Ferrimonas balearica]|uniref:hypothetical protein n=1 Tax=Ferrimonas balearica TaxID=44012 RepID=UPI001C995E3B|nr:hypothetical protein [Ferrimonas balearica]MBY5992942.1 hypothetical protein [Ferrimonas balearica]